MRTDQIPLKSFYFARDGTDLLHNMDYASFSWKGTDYISKCSPSITY
jgi:hypothetical protein